VVIRILFGTFLIAHGLAHLVGFATAFRLGDAAANYSTSIFGGRIDLGEGGIRAYGIAWLLLAAAFVAVAAGIFTRQGWWPAAAIAVTAASLVFSILGLPLAKIGVGLNVALLVVLAAHSRWDWIPD
jgi:hypothetical protein